MAEPRKHRQLIFKLSLAVAGMFAFSFLMVPLYNTFCDITGINGKTGGRMRLAEIDAVDTSRTIRLEFLTHNNQGMTWEFYPEVKYIDIHPGEVKRVNFYAKNTTEQDMVGQSIPSVSPGIGAKYLKKTECFCFEQQPLKAGQEEWMPLVFYIDPKIPRDVKDMTLSYTLFDITGRTDS